MVPGPRHYVGTDYLVRATEFLTACRLADPLGGMWDAAELQWWWREDDFDVPGRQLFYESQGTVRAMLLLAGRHATFDYELAPGEENGELGRLVAEAGMAWLDALSVADPDATASFYVRDDHAVLRRVAELHGYRPTGDELVQGAAKLPALVTNAVLPDGYTVRPFRRSDVQMGHQPVLSTPALEIERLKQTGLYRPEHHLVVSDPQDLAVAECIAWIDHSTSIGVLEPVATHRAHRRHGLARCMVSFALEAMAREGVALAKVSWESSNSGATALYRSLGFEPSFRRLLYAG